MPHHTGLTWPTWSQRNSYLPTRFSFKVLYVLKRCLFWSDLHFERMYVTKHRRFWNWWYSKTVGIQWHRMYLARDVILLDSHLTFWAVWLEMANLRYFDIEPLCFFAFNKNKIKSLFFCFFYTIINEMVCYVLLVWSFEKITLSILYCQV